MSRGFGANFSEKKWKFKVGYFCTILITFILFIVGVIFLAPGPTICGCEEFYAADEVLAKFTLIDQNGAVCPNSGETKCRQYRGKTKQECEIYFEDPNLGCVPHLVKSTYAEQPRAFEKDSTRFWVGLAFALLVFIGTGCICMMTWRVADGTA
eukprot:gb/GEZN01018920.1/.p1 GENE.gb/GEZN01018920.1/~~gb/GEZN01018920.1/.p1  ORF type:complete len:153 (-),score=11.45 gb/GEZN01018920.1/:215-673(-)